MAIPTIEPLHNPIGWKARLKARLQSIPALWNFYWGVKQQIRRAVLLRYYFYDLFNTYRFMFWQVENANYRMLSAELIFQYHKIEKGLVMPGQERLFSVEPAHACMAAIRRWQAAGFNQRDPVFVGAIHTLFAYEYRLAIKELDPNDKVLSRVQKFLSEFSARDASLLTPHTLALAKETAPADFHALSLARRSVRSFVSTPIDEEVIAAAVGTAQLSPSACNRQPWHVYVVSDTEKKRQLLSHQNGNRGFGHLAPHIAIITSDAQCFFDATERHEPYVDGGLFSMSFILSLAAHGVGSCCLNWCVSPKTDKTVHRLFSIPTSRRIVMLIAFGYPTEDCLVPRSPRRAIDDVLSHI